MNREPCRQIDRRRLVALCALALTGVLVGTTACDKDGDGGESTPPPPPEPITATIAVEGGSVTPGVTLTTQVPGNWQADEFFEGTWMPEGAQVMEAQLSASVSCGGACEAGAIPGQIQSAIDDRLEAYRSGLGQSEPQFRAEVEVLERGELPLGHFIAYRLDYPEVPAGEASGRDGTHLDCYLHRPDDPFYVLLEAQSDAEHADAIWPALRPTCEQATYE